MEDHRYNPLRLIIGAFYNRKLEIFLRSQKRSRLSREPGMLILVLVLKDSLRTFFKSLSWSLGVRSLSLSWSLWSGPCPYPGPCGLVLVLVFSPCKDLFPLFHYSDLFTYYCSVNAYN